MIEEIKKQPSQEIVDYLERLLSEAKDGTLQSIALAILFNDASSDNGWAGMGKNNIKVIGELTILKQLITDQYVQQQKEIIGNE